MPIAFLRNRSWAMLRNEGSSIVDLICFLWRLKPPGSPVHVNASPPRPFEDLIHLSVSAQRATLDESPVTGDFRRRAAGFRLHACCVWKRKEIKKRKEKKKAPPLFGLNYSEIGLTQDFYFSGMFRWKRRFDWHLKCLSVQLVDVP